MRLFSESLRTRRRYEMVMPMNRNSIRWQLPASYGLIAFLAALSLGSVMLLVLRNYYVRQERDYLYGNAFALQPILEQFMQSDLPEKTFQDQINGLAFLSQTQIRLLDSEQNVIADSGEPGSHQVVAVSGQPAPGMVMFTVPVNPLGDETPALIDGSEGEFTPSATPVVKPISPSEGDLILPVSASPYGYGFVTKAGIDSTRRSSEAVRVVLKASDGTVLGELEISKGPSYGADIIRSVSLAWLIASVFAIAIAAVTGWFISQRVTRPVLVLETATRQMEQGDLAVRVDLQDEPQQEFLSLAHSFNSMAEQVEQTVSTLRSFVADAAHELHTPLTALQANLELAHNETDPSEQAHYLLFAQQQGERLEVLVQNLLDLSRIEAAESRSTFMEVDLVQLVREVGEQFASRAEQADRSFTLTLPGEVVPVQGNETQLRQVLSNLLENALKFTPANGSISLDLERHPDHVRLTVSDSGIGIPAEDLPHLFERFHRGRNASEYPGNGLGLAIVKAIVNTHRGDVAVHTEQGRGTSISVSLPMS
jgi:signal transduction histidine kinase